MSEFEKFIEDNFKELKGRVESGNFFAKTMKDSMHATWLKRQSEIDQLKAEQNELVGLIEGNFDTTSELSCMVLALIKERDQLKAEKAGFKNLVKSLRSEFDLNGGSDQVERQIELLEEAVRGGDQNTKNSTQAIESNGSRGGDQNGEH